MDNWRLRNNLNNLIFNSPFELQIMAVIYLEAKVVKRDGIDSCTDRVINPALIYLSQLFINLGGGRCSFQPFGRIEKHCRLDP